jgi:hypothetical protein
MEPTPRYASSTRAFSLIELLMVDHHPGHPIGAFRLSYNSIRLQTRFNAQKNEIVRLVEEARSLSLSSIFVVIPSPQLLPFDWSQRREHRSVW